MIYPSFLVQSRHLIWTRFRRLRRDETLEYLILFETLPDQYQISRAVLWDCILTLKIEPQKLDGQIYLTAQNLKRLEQFIRRIEISWACPHILGTCGHAARKT
jgi:hypothetical protein